MLITHVTSQSRKAFYGSLVHSISLTELEYIEDALMGVSELGVIAFVERNVAEEAVTDKLAELDFADCELVKLASGEFLMPGYAPCRSLATGH